MARPAINPTGVERSFAESEIIVSKTDTKGILTYANPLFLSLADYTEDEVIGEPHNMIRHPDMPRCVFNLLWERISNGKEIFAYVVNLAKNGDHYWVQAHVTPNLDMNRNVVGYHSTRRVPKIGALRVIQELYPQLVAKERQHGSSKDGMAAAGEMFNEILNEKGVDYDEFIHRLA
jgi:PAS domain S-box-containing protein